MLVYNPAFDVHHGIFRLTQLLYHLSPKDIEIEKLCILDFYLLFPIKLSDVRLTPELRNLIKTIVDKKENPYSKVSNAKTVFQQMQSYQMTSINCLASYELINKDALDLDIIRLNISKISTDLFLAIEEHYSKEKRLIDFLTDHLAEIDLKKKNGLKDRTGLFEYKYDV